MLLRNSITNTKKFFQKTIDNVKSFLSKGSTYEKLPKTPPFHPFACGRDGTDIESGCKDDLDNFYVEFTNQWDSHNTTKPRNRFHKTKKSHEFYTQQQQQQQQRRIENYVTPARIEAKDQNTAAATTVDKTYEVLPKKQGGLSENASSDLKSKISDVRQGVVLSDVRSRSVRERSLSSVARKMKEIELMDKGNAEHKLDVEEVLHYYARLTCPAYLDIVDKFFTEICNEFLNHQVSSSVNSLRPDRRCNK